MEKGQVESNDVDSIIIISLDVDRELEGTEGVL